MARVKSLQLIAELSITAFALKSDCLALVQAINSQEEDLLVLGGFVSLIQSLISTLNCQNISHVSQRGNIPTYLLARHSLSLSETLVWIEAVPNHVLLSIGVDME